MLQSPPVATRRRRTIPTAVLELFQDWGRAGGLARAANLTATERHEAAVKAGRARWPAPRAAEVAQIRAWGREGGLARAARLTADERRRIAKKAASARWTRRPD